MNYLQYSPHHLLSPYTRWNGCIQKDTLQPLSTMPGRPFSRQLNLAMSHQVQMWSEAHHWWISSLTVCIGKDATISMLCPVNTLILSTFPGEILILLVKRHWRNSWVTILQGNWMPTHSGKLFCFLEEAEECHRKFNISSWYRSCGSIFFNSRCFYAS